MPPTSPATTTMEVLSLTSLPHKTLLRVLQHISNSIDLYKLALVSRRLNQLAMPLYLCRQGIHIKDTWQAPYVHISLPDQTRILLAFRLGFFISSIGSLHCSLTSRSASTDYRNGFQHNLDSLVALLQTYRIRIKRVTVNNKVDPASLPVATTTHDNDKKLCNAVFDHRSACVEMELCDDNGDRRTYKRGYHHTPPTLCEMFIDSSSKGNKWKRITLRSDNYQISSYVFKSHRQLLSAHRQGTLDLIRNTYSLDLSFVDLWGEAWTEVLSKIQDATRSSIHMLRLNPKGIITADLFAFLSRLPRLQALTIDPPNADTQLYNHPFYQHQPFHHPHHQQFRYRDRQRNRNFLSQDSYDPLTHSVRPSFPDLHIISAPLTLIPFLLSGSTPKLQSLTIIVHRASTLFSPSSEKLFAQTATLLERRKAQLPKRKRRIGTPHLTMSVTFDLPEIWCMSVNLNDYFRSGIGGMTGERSGEGGGGSERFLKMVDSLAIISRSPFPFSGDEMSTSVLCQWLRRFPGVRTLHIEDTHASMSYIHHDLHFHPRHHHHMGYRYPHHHHHYYTPSSVYSILHAIRIQCPNIRTVILDKAYEVEDVLEEREGGDNSGKTRRGWGMTTTYPSVFGTSDGSASACADTSVDQEKFRGLGDLNEDLFYLIFQYLETKDLYPLSRVSRNLLCWVLPVYLFRRGYPTRNPFPSDSTSNVIEICLFIDSMDPLLDISALTLSPTIHTISHLSCSLSSGVSLYRAYEFLKRLVRLMRKLQGVGKMKLDFGGMLFSSSSIGTESATGDAKRVWTRLVMELFEEVRRKADVFVVRGCGYFQSLTGAWGEVFGGCGGLVGLNGGGVSDVIASTRMSEGMSERGAGNVQKQQKRRSILSSMPTPKFHFRRFSQEHSSTPSRSSFSFSSSGPPSLSNSPVLTFTSLGSPLQQHQYEQQGQQQQLALQSQMQPRSLTKLKIESEALLLPVFRDWARSALRGDAKSTATGGTTTTTKLRVTKLTYLTVPFLRELVAEDLVKPKGATLSLDRESKKPGMSVRDLKLEGDTVMMEDVLSVIGCLKNLERLEIDGCTWKSAGSGTGGGGGRSGKGTGAAGARAGSSPNLKYLKRLSAPVEYIVHLLRGDVATSGIEVGACLDKENDNDLAAGGELEDLAVRVLNRRDRDGTIKALKTIEPIVDRLMRSESGGDGKTGVAVAVAFSSLKQTPKLLLTVDIYLQPTPVSIPRYDHITTQGWETVANTATELVFRFDFGFEDVIGMGMGTNHQQHHHVLNINQHGITIATNSNVIVAHFNHQPVPPSPPSPNSGSGSNSGFGSTSTSELQYWIALFPRLRKLTVFDAPSVRTIVEGLELGKKGMSGVSPGLEEVVVNGHMVKLVSGPDGEGKGKGKGKGKEREWEFAWSFD